MDTVQAGVRSILSEFKIRSMEGRKLVSAGILDSILLVELALALEARFSIEVSPLDLTPENFNSEEQIVRFVKSKHEV